MLQIIERFENLFDKINKLNTLTCKKTIVETEREKLNNKTWVV